MVEISDNFTSNDNRLAEGSGGKQMNQIASRKSAVKFIYNECMMKSLKTASQKSGNL